MDRSSLIHAVEDRLRRITHLIYDTSVSPLDMDAEVTPYLADDVRFTDPWQDGAGREKYRLGVAGFHCMRLFNFHLELYQLHAHLDQDGKRGRALADGVMHLRPIRALPPYPLRTILTYKFEVTDPDAEGGPRFLIHEQDEMWSFGDMIEAVPGVGWFYGHVFRPTFSRGFLALSYLSARAKRLLPPDLRLAG